MLDGLFALLDGVCAAADKKNGPVVRILATCFVALFLGGGLLLLLIWLS